jgi:hypothetical protein
VWSALHLYVGHRETEAFGKTEAEVIEELLQPKPGSHLSLGRAFGKTEAEVIEEGSLRAIGAYDAAEAQFARGRSCDGQDDVGALNGADLVQKGTRAIPQASALLPLLEGLPQDIGQKAHQDMRLHAIGPLVPDGEQPYLIG